MKLGDSYEDPVGETGPEVDALKVIDAPGEGDAAGAFRGDEDPEGCQLFREEALDSRRGHDEDFFLRSLHESKLLGLAPGPAE
jgi:hypothetical protein